MHLHELYRAILASLNVVAGDDDLLSLQYADKSFPATVEGKRLVVPSPTVLRAGLGDKLIAFHPLSENVLRGESPILRKFKVYVTNKLTQTLSDLVMAFVEIAADHKGHAKLTPPQKELLLALPDADEKTVSLLGDIYDMMAEDNKRKLLSIYLKRGGTLRMERFARTAVVSFPIMKEFENDERTVYGVKCRKADYLGLARLFEYMLPGGDGAGYSAGSNDSDVPYFDALIKAYVKTATQLNTLTTLFKKQLANADELLIDLSWAGHTLDWKKFRDLIPVLDGNDGVTAAEDTSDEPAPTAHAHRGFDPTRAAAAAAASAHTHHPVAATAPGQAQPTAPEAPVIRKTADGLNWQDIVNAANRRSVQPAPHQPVAPGYGYPAPPPGHYPPVALDYYGRPIPTPVMQAPPQAYYMEPSPPGFGPPPGQPGQPMFDNMGRPIHPGYGAPQPYQNPRQPSFGPNAGPAMYAGGYPQGRQPSFGPGAMAAPPPQYFNHMGQPMMYPPQGNMMGQPMMYPQQGYMQPPPPGFGGQNPNMFAGAPNQIPVYGR